MTSGSENLAAPLTGYVGSVTTVDFSDAMLKYAEMKGLPCGL